MRPSIVAISSEPGFLHLIQTLFAGAGLGDGLVVRTSSEWESAPALVERLRPSLVILDLRLWEDTCWRVLEALKASPATDAIPVLVCPVAISLLAGHERLLALRGVHVWADGFRVQDLLETAQLALAAAPLEPAMR